MFLIAVYNEKSSANQPPLISVFYILLYKKSWLILTRSKVNLPSPSPFLKFATTANKLHYKYLHVAFKRRTVSSPRIPFSGKRLSVRILRRYEQKTTKITGILCVCIFCNKYYQRQCRKIVPIMKKRCNFSENKIKKRVSSEPSAYWKALGL